jgi:hypothetical protein
LVRLYAGQLLNYTALQFKIQEIAANFFFSISTIPKPLIPGVSIILASKTSHTQSSGVLLALLASEIVCF